MIITAAHTPIPMGAKRERSGVHDRDIATLRPMR